MIDTASTSQPPLWPSVGALLVSGWVGGVVATILWAPLLGATRFGSVFTPGVLTATWLAPTLAGVLVASALLPRLLRAFCEFELGLGSAFVVTLGRSLAGFAASTFFTATVPTAGHADVRDVLPPARDPFARGRLPAPEAAEPVPRLARSGPVAQRRLELPEASAPRAATGEWEHLLAAVRIEVAQTLAILEQAERADVPGTVAEALPGLEALADRIEEATAPSPSGHAAQLDLAAGIRSLQGALVDLGETAWRGGHRREIERLRCLDEIHSALAQLDSVR